MIDNEKSIQLIRELHRQHSFDFWLVHNVVPIGSYGIYREAKRLGVPIVQYLHNYGLFSVGGSLWLRGGVNTKPLHENYFSEIFYGAWQGSQLKSTFKAIALLWLRRSGWLSSVKSWVTLSNFMRDRLIEERCLEPFNTFSVPHSWDSSVHCDANNLKFSGYLFLGRLTEEKGIVVLLEAWDFLRVRLGTRCPMLHIAGSGPLTGDVLKATQRNEFITFHDWVDAEKKESLLTGCRAVVVPSLWWEPLGLTAYEAFDYSKPVLAASIGGLSETVVHGVSGFSHKPGDYKTLIDQILIFEADINLARTMGKNGKNWLINNTSRTEWLAAFDEVVNFTLQIKSF